MQLLITCKTKGKGVSAADDNSDTRCILFWSCMFNKCWFQSCEARFPPRSPNMLINWGKHRRSKEAWRHYIKTELSDFLLKACCQVPIIRVPFSFPTRPTTDPPLRTAEMCCSSTIFLINVFSKKLSSLFRLQPCKDRRETIVSNPSDCVKRCSE